MMGCTLAGGSPSRDGLPGRGSRRPVNYLWWALARTGGFSRPDFAELRIERAGRVMQRLIVTPRWYRFPFMGPADLQIGDVWTAPDARRQQLARLRRCSGEPALRHKWYDDLVRDRGRQ